MYHGRNMLEQPFMRAVLYIVDLRKFETSQATPAAGYDSSSADQFDRVEQDRQQTFHVFANNASEANVDRRWTRAQESAKLCWWVIFNRFAKEKTTDI